jgi:hypothetical protein
LSGYPLPKNPIEAAYLQRIREKNARIASICHYCKKQSTGINSDVYKIIFVCKEHLNDIS